MAMLTVVEPNGVVASYVAEARGSFGTLTDNAFHLSAMIFNPQIQGAVPIRLAAPEFLEAFRQRISAGFLTGRPHPRSNYRISETGPDRLVVHAADWWTAINVGLNELALDLPQRGSVHYRVRYWRWVQYGLALSGMLGLIGIVLLVSLDVRGYIARHSTSMLPGLSVDQNLLIAWFMVLFWGFAWPWLLIPMHKRPLRGLVERLIAEVDAQVTLSTH
ncbi:MAG: hypothetical protein A3H97_15650 [Acidobacteria bacterium RIFCSPLOWO2_02_FULL_65_29]|nr:MAG: hypothetical protein A3H97_15650 [Acidobacteria bacterium RIFCSPLOWO2_02_FULL_65_29]